EQFAVPEGLAAGREAGAAGWLLQQRIRRVRLQHTGLLVVGVAVDHAVRPAERAGGVHGIQGLVEPRVLPGRHLVHHLRGGRAKRGAWVGSFHGHATARPWRARWLTENVRPRRAGADATASTSKGPGERPIGWPSQAGGVNGVCLMWTVGRATCICTHWTA